MRVMSYYTKSENNITYKEGECYIEVLSSVDYTLLNLLYYNGV